MKIENRVFITKPNCALSKEQVTKFTEDGKQMDADDITDAEQKA